MCLQLRATRQRAWQRLLFPLLITHQSRLHDEQHSNSSQPQRPALFALRDVVTLAQVSTSCRAACCACRMASILPSASMHVLPAEAQDQQPRAASAGSEQRVLLTLDSLVTE